MNELENKMVEILKNLKEHFGVVGVKAEFEAEGSRFNELIKLKSIISQAGLGLYIKIGGCEAVRDILDCEILDTEGIIAPMIESPFALRKFSDMVKKQIPEEIRQNLKFGITFETKTAHQCIKDIVSSEHFNLLSTFTIGRVDLSCSYGLTRKDINSPEMLGYCKDIFQKVGQNERLIKCIGGGISLEATDFIKELVSYGLKRFETRKIIFEIPHALNNLEKGLKLAMDFEYLWLRNKREYYGRIHNEDDERMKMIKQRLEETKGIHKAW